MLTKIKLSIIAVIMILCSIFLFQLYAEKYYFVSYTFESDTGNIGFGNITLTTRAHQIYPEDMNNLKNTIEKNNSGTKNVIILNFQRVK